MLTTLATSPLVLVAASALAQTSGGACPPHVPMNNTCNGSCGNLGDKCTQDKCFSCVVGFDDVVRRDAGVLALLAAIGLRLTLRVVQKELGRGPTGIGRIDGQRVTNITANLEPGVALGDAVERIRTELLDTQLPAGYSIVFGGEYEEQQKAASPVQASGP